MVNTNNSAYITAWTVGKQPDSWGYRNYLGPTDVICLSACLWEESIGGGDCSRHERQNKIICDEAQVFFS